MSSKLAIWCEHLGKRYLVPHRRQEAPSFFADVKNHLKEYTGLVRRDEQSDYFWALNDIGFEIGHGEIVGIVGRNGSGKSTLLKILSGVTQPTTGKARLQGRVGSLLEVGTGFHPDMTGRENVYMSGALLGLSQADIRKKFDEIVDFSGIGSFIDVPVKRYSSGMYVRLAFSVASLLSSDILILDEVLAVGDIAFTEKSEKLIHRIANDGRTVLFVSHNMQAVRHLCQRAIVLNKGRMIADGPSDEAVQGYLQMAHDGGEERVDIRTLPPRVDISVVESEYNPRPMKTLKWVEITNAEKPTRAFRTGDKMVIRIGYEMPMLIDPCYFTIFVLNDVGERMFVSYSFHDRDRVSFPQAGVLECSIDLLPLLDGIFTIEVDFGRVGGMRTIDFVPHAIEFVVEQRDYLGARPLIRNQGSFAQRTLWKATPNSSVSSEAEPDGTHATSFQRSEADSGAGE